MNRILSGLVAVAACSLPLLFAAADEPSQGVTISKRMSREEALAKLEAGNIAPHPGNLVAPVLNGDPEMVAALLDAGVDVNSETGLPKPILRLAMSACADKEVSPENQLAIVELLLSHGAEVNEKKGGELSPLMVAAQHCPGEVVHRLVKAGADMNFKTSLGQSPLAMAFIVQNYAAAEALIEEGARLTEAGAARLLEGKEGDARRVALIQKARGK